MCRTIDVIKEHKVEITIAAISVAVILRGFDRVLDRHKVVVSFMDLPDPIVLAATEGLMEASVK